MLAQSKEIGTFNSLNKGWHGFDLDTGLLEDILFIDHSSFYYKTFMVDAVLADALNPDRD